MKDLISALTGAALRLDEKLSALGHLDGLPILLIRLYLVPVFWMAGTSKLLHFNDTVAWFGSTDAGLGLPFPELMAVLATGTEIIGAGLLLLGLGVRWVSMPLLVTMVVAAVTVHAENGWQSIADASAPFANERVMASVEKLARVREILHEHGNYEWLTASGPVVILNNGVEFATTYALMLAVLIAYGGGRYVSLDWLIARGFRER